MYRLGGWKVLILVSTIGIIKCDFAGADSEELSALTVAEGECFQPTLAPYISPFWFLSKRTFYIPVASQYSFLNYAEAFLGRSASSWDEVEEMCLKVDVSGLQARTYGYDRIIDQSCLPTFYIIQAMTLGQFTCEVTHSSPWTNASLFRDYMDNVVMTDNESYFLIVRCINGIRDYKVLSVTPTIPENVTEEVIKKIEEMGFDPKLMKTLGCSKCRKHETDCNIHSSEKDFSENKI